jgi:hypothetical protein
MGGKLTGVGDRAHYDHAEAAVRLERRKHAGADSVGRRVVAAEQIDGDTRHGRLRLQTLTT